MDGADRVPGSSGGQSVFCGLIDHAETYGPHVIHDFADRLGPVRTAVDLGAGQGRDLGIVRHHHPDARLHAVEAGHAYAETLRPQVDAVHVLDIEHDRLPFEDISVDLVIANQVLEHTKEIFWIFHEVSRVLRIGGHFIVGVPNVASLHNRILLLLGVYPTQHKLCSAHVRPFSIPDTRLFLDVCWPGGYEITSIVGSQFYPLPPKAARVAARLFPSLAFSIFFLLMKCGPYQGEFLEHPVKATLETNFWLGPESGSQY